MYRSAVPINKERHGGKRVKQLDSFAFARSSSAMPIMLAEAPLAAGDFPIAFTRDGDGIMPTALLSAEPNSNQFVTRDGRWADAYIPATIRRYPFILGRSPDRDELMLCIDEESGVLSDDQGEPVFDESGEPGQSVRRAVQFCTELEASRRATLTATAVLEKEGLFKPWLLRIQLDDSVRELGGLMRIEPTEFENLPDDALLRIRKAGALGLVYAHFVSMSRVRVLSRRNGIAAVAPSPAAVPTRPAAPKREREAPDTPPPVPIEEMVFRF